MEALIFILIGVAVGSAVTFLTLKSKVKSKFFTITATKGDAVEKQLKHKLSEEFPLEILSKKTYPTSTTFELRYVK